MKRLLKIALTLLGTLIALVLIVILLIVFVIDPNHYKVPIADFVKNATGRTLNIEGDIKLTVYPWLGFKLGKISLSNAPGFKEPEFATINQTRVQVKLMSLFNEPVEVGTILLEGIEVTLTRKPKGNNNWEDLVALVDGSEESNTPNLAFNGLYLRQFKIVWDDQLEGTRYVLSDANLSTPAFSLKSRQLKLTFNGNLEIIDTRRHLQLALDSQVSIHILDSENQQYRIAPLQLSATVQGDNIPSGQQILSMTTQTVDVDLIQEMVKIGGIRFKSGDAILSGDFEIQQFQRLTGTVKLADLKLQELIKQLDLNLKADLKRLPFFQNAKVALETQLEASLTGINLINMWLSVDENQLKIPQISIDFQKETLNAKALSLQILGMKLNAQKVSVKKIFSHPIATGKLVLFPFNPRKTLQQLERIQLLPAISLPDKKLFPLKTANLKTQFFFHESNRVMNLNNLHLRLDNNKFDSKQINFNFAKDILTLDRFILSVLGVKISGKLSAKQLSTKPTLQGSLRLSRINPRRILRRFGQTAPKTADPSVLKALTIKTQLQSDFSTLHLYKLKISLDNSNLQGNLQIQDFKKPVIAFNLALDKIDISRYSAPPKKAASKPLSGKDILSTVKEIRALDMSGNLKIGQLEVADIKIKNANLYLEISKGQIKLNPPIFGILK
jgi:AsmA protein